MRACGRSQAVQRRPEARRSLRAWHTRARASSSVGLAALLSKAGLTDEQIADPSARVNVGSQIRFTWGWPLTR
jgi:hypothetical protein